MLVIAVLSGMSFFFVSCEGPNGKDGKDGDNGANGQEQCGTCHNSSSLIVAKQLQWAASQHALGSEFERTSTTCAGCHTNEGFHEVLQTGEFNTAAEVLNPTGQNCRTCHNVHKEYKDTDWALTKTGDVKFRSAATNFDFGKGALCATCHQSRALSVPLDISNPSATYQITSTSFGPHYSTAANAFAANGAIEITGPETYVKTFIHQSVLKNTCVDCHMAKARGAEAGGHTMKMSYPSSTGTPTAYVAACTGCHEGLKNFDYNSTQTKIKALIGELRTKLVAKNLLDTTTSNGVWTSDRAKIGTYPVNHVAAIFNYRWLTADQSWGVHNPKYINAVVKNSINAVQ
jgi:formate-dependent nitrite reductase cytochrome c552 subunit